MRPAPIFALAVLAAGGAAADFACQFDQKCDVAGHCVAENTRAVVDITGQKLRIEEEEVPISYMKVEENHFVVIARSASQHFTLGRYDGTGLMDKGAVLSIGPLDDDTAELGYFGECEGFSG
jgi:hypothetical protein